MKLDHLGIAVTNLEEGGAFYRTLGLELEGVEEVEEQGVKVGFFALGDSRIELLEPTGPESPIARHLERRGPGLHHLCVRVDDIREKMMKLRAEGYELLSDEPQAGAHGCLVCFVHPRSTGGVLLELSQKV